MSAAVSEAEANRLLEQKTPAAQAAQSLEKMIRQFEVVSWKLDLAAEHYGDLSGTVDSDLGAARVVQEVAEELTNFYCELRAWQSDHCPKEAQS